MLLSLHEKRRVERRCLDDAVGNLSLIFTTRCEGNYVQPVLPIFTAITLWNLWSKIYQFSVDLSTECMKDFYL